MDPSDFGNDDSESDYNESVDDFNESQDDFEVSKSTGGSGRSKRDDWKPPIDGDMDYVTPEGVELTSESDYLTTLDFTKAYVTVALSDDGDYYVSKDEMGVTTDSGKRWRRMDKVGGGACMVLEDHIEIQRVWTQAIVWARFCDKLQEKFGENGGELLDNDPDRLLSLSEDVMLDPGSKPSVLRTCQVCGATSNDDDSTIVELDMHETRQLPVCSSHSVMELAENGFLS